MWHKNLKYKQRLNFEEKMTQIHFNTAFNQMSEIEIRKWLNDNKERLIGSAIFTKGDSFISNAICWAEKWRCKEEHFVPSHTGSIIDYNDELYIFDMKPIRASIQPLSDFLLNSNLEYALVIRDFLLDIKMFSINIAEHIGEFYPYMSAIRSVFSKRESKWTRHCSEMHLRELQKQGLFKEINPEITPDELFHILGKIK